jgi:hypothetical protein
MYHSTRRERRDWMRSMAVWMARPMRSSLDSVFAQRAGIDVSADADGADVDLVTAFEDFR